MGGQIARHIGILRNAGQNAGTWNTLQWYWSRLWQKFALGRRPKVWEAQPRQLKFPLAVDTGGSSDLMVFEQIFIAEEYRCLRDLKEVAVILDLGANVGFSSAYFLSCFPQARMVAVEPDERNVAVCQKNLRRYGTRATVLHGAAWSQCGKLCLVRGAFRDGLDWATQVAPPSEGRTADIDAWDLGTLMDMAGAEKVDLLKIDIEGAEADIFGDSSRQWLDRVRNICIELHGPACEEIFFSALRGFDYDLARSGELTICRNLCRAHAQETTPEKYKSQHA